MNITYDEIAKLSPEERELLEKLMKEEGVDISTLPIPRRHSGIKVPLTPTQMRFWLLERIHPGTSAYNIPIFFKIKGKLSIKSLEKSFKYLIQRHSLLRTKFIETDGEPYQQIFERDDFKLNETELRKYDLSDNDPNVLKILNNELQKPFDFKNDFLLRIHLIVGKKNEYILSIVTHHLAADGWSMRIFLRELNELYNSFVAQKNTSLKELAIDFPDYACWLNDHLDNNNIQQQLKYWKEKLSGASLVLDLPTDFSRPPVEKYHGSAYHFEFSPVQVEKISSLTKKMKVTKFVMIMSLFQGLLHKYSRQNDIIVATAISNRSRSEVEDIIGNFSNNLLIHTNFSDDPSLERLAANIRLSFLEALQNQDLPFEKLVEEMNVARSLSRNALFQVMFLLHEGRHDKIINFPGTEIRELEPETTTSKFDMFLEVHDGKDSLKGIIEYNSDLFKETTIELMVKHFFRLIEEWSVYTDLPFSKIDILTVEEKKLLVEINNTNSVYPKDLRLHNLFEMQVERTHGKVAVEFEGKHLTYSELNSTANQVARYLRKLGIEEGGFVGICVERSIEMLIGIIGILKAGCVYIPLDPAFPANRLNYMLNDANIKMLLTSNKLKDIFNKEDVKIILLDEDWNRIEKENVENVNSQVSSEDLAYVIYTSGSTGNPKGVQIKHKAVVNFLLSMQKEPGLTSNDVFVSITTMSFDISVLELFLPIITGAKLIIASKAATSDGKLLLKLLEETNATVMQATPSTWRLIIEAGWKTSRSLKMLCGGEALSLELANQMLERGGSLWNMYGPTETTIWSSVKKIEPGSDAVLIGPPIANTQFYILDKDIKPVPVGVPGELFIGGEGLANGYLHRPELTSEKFISNPFLNSDAKLYKTGDLTRFKHNGDVEFLGRLDFQVKIRGFRIELGEIENILTTYPEIKDVVVSAWQDSSGDKKLVAYYIPLNGESIKVSELRSFLTNKLPEYMVPSFFIKLDKFPLTPNAKIDRNKLPSPNLSELSIERKFVAPAHELEIQLAEIWKKVLKLKAVGIHDNFFELGGHSLLVVQLFRQIEEKIKIELSIALIFECPTINQLSTKILEINR